MFTDTRWCATLTSDIVLLPSIWMTCVQHALAGRPDLGAVRQLERGVRPASSPMADADLIAVHELKWTAWASRRHAVYDTHMRELVYTAGYLLPTLRCRLWALRNGYRLRERTLFPHRISTDADGPTEYERIAIDLVRRERERGGNVPGPAVTGR